MVTGFCCLMTAGLFLSISANQAEARPNYFKKAFLKVYTNHAEAKKAKCNTCHFGKKKKNMNDYGVAIKKALGKKKVKDVDVIKAALKKVEPEKSKIDGKTFGELLKDGKLPGTAP
jgi:hypothetical protein